MHSTIGSDIRNVKLDVRHFDVARTKGPFGVVCFTVSASGDGSCFVLMFTINLLDCFAIFVRSTYTTHYQTLLTLQSPTLALNQNIGIASKLSLLALSKAV